MQNQNQEEHQLLRSKRELFRVEIRKKNLEESFTQVRRRFLIQDKPHIEIEQQQVTSICLKHHPIELLLDENVVEGNKVIEDILIDIQSQLEKGMHQDVLEWAGPMDLVSAVVKLMNKSNGLAQQASSCFESLVVVESQKIREQVSGQTEQAIRIYQKWITNPEQIGHALKGVNALFDSQGISHQLSEEMIEQILETLWKGNPSEKIKSKLWKVLSSGGQYIRNEILIIQLLKIAQSLFESGERKKIIRGVMILTNISKQNISFVMATSCIKQVFELVFSRDVRINYIVIDLVVEISCSNDRDILQSLVQLDIFDLIIRMLKDNRKCSNRQSGSLILSNLLFNESLHDYYINNNLLKDETLLLMERDSLAVRRELFYSWLNFLTQATLQNTILALQSGILHAVVRGLDDINSLIIILTLKIIFQILNRFQGNFDIQNQIIQFLIQNNFIQYLQDFQNQKNQEILKTTQSIINNFFYSE